MAQIIKHNYQDPLNSYPFNLRLLGLLRAGRYCGFDGINKINGTLNLELTHTVTGVYHTQENLSVNGPLGSLLTHQGMVVHEDAPVSLSITSNAGNAFTRKDLVIFEHEYLNSPGGQNGIYSIVPGSPGGPSLPPIPNPEKQIVIGILTIPANATVVDNVTYEPAQTPLPGGQNIISNFPELDARYARLNTTNVFTKRQNFPAATGVSLSSLFGTFSGGKWTPHDNANSFTYPAGQPSITIKEIEATTNNNEILLVNLSVNPITISLNAVPSLGGLTILGNMGTGNKPLVLGTNGWVKLVQITNTGYIITGHSQMFSDIYEGRKAYALNPTDFNVTGGINSLTGQGFKYKITGNIIEIHFSYSIVFNIAINNWEVDIANFMPYNASHTQGPWAIFSNNLNHNSPDTYIGLKGVYINGASKVLNFTDQTNGISMGVLSSNVEGTIRIDMV
jgi:hypothetical protein